MSAILAVLPFGSSQARHFYRCYLFAASGHIEALETIACRDDDEAQAFAERIFEHQPDCAALELWDVGRVMLRLSREAPQPVLAHAA
jgi:hypothetical protein